MPNIIFKKNFKVKPSGFQIANEKSFSFHGTAVTPQIISAINHKLASIKHIAGTRPLDFKMNQYDHYSAFMNHDYQKHHEEDAIVSVLDVMESLGWTFQFQYDSESLSQKVSGSSFTTRELFLFHKA
jgi:hypothetical protein